MKTYKIKNWLLFVRTLIKGLPPEYIEKQRERAKKAKEFEEYFNKIA